ncbi:unnamed protein product [Schistosoma margrebowiei]|uniref:Uncharacterized protein n=1 Tax=Schistosoma margrebowiei TaxID=48269 RepID=A0A183M734_9TREM|nr:unnamed protein product [Schistosoma margrebowiei]
MQSDSTSDITWEREKSTCEVDTTVMFRGHSKNRLKMFIMPRNQVEYYMNHTGVKERSTEVFILFNRRGDRFSLPTIGNIFSCLSLFAKCLVIEGLIKKMMCIFERSVLTFQNHTI